VEEATNTDRTPSSTQLALRHTIRPATSLHELSASFKSYFAPVPLQRSLSLYIRSTYLVEAETELGKLDETEKEKAVDARAYPFT
jgi:hypothetical protein